MKFVFCHKLELREYNNIESHTNMVVGVESSNLGSFGVIRWTLKEWLENHSKKDINYCISKGIIDYTYNSAVWIEKR